MPKPLMRWASAPPTAAAGLAMAVPQARLPLGLLKSESSVFFSRV